MSYTRQFCPSFTSWADFNKSSWFWNDGYRALPHKGSNRLTVRLVNLRPNYGVFGVFPDFRRTRDVVDRQRPTKAADNAEFSTSFTAADRRYRKRHRQHHGLSPPTVEEPGITTATTGPHHPRFNASFQGEPRLVRFPAVTQANSASYPQRDGK